MQGLFTLVCLSSLEAILSSSEAEGERYSGLI